MRWAVAFCLLWSCAAATPPPVLRPLQPHDVLGLTVWGHKDLSGDLVVLPDGNLRLPFAGNVQVAGLRPPEAAERIAAVLSDGYLANPGVSVELHAGGPGPEAFVLGYVARPGAYPVEPGDDLVRLLARAGGCTAEGGDVLVLTRSSTSPGEAPSTQRLDLVAALSGNACQSPRVRDGDVLYVPKAPSFYVSGEVKAPGRFRWEPGITVRRAVAIAGGCTGKGVLSKARVYRLEAGRESDLAAHLDAPVEAEDVIHIPETLF